MPILIGCKLYNKLIVAAANNILDKIWMQCLFKKSCGKTNEKLDNLKRNKKKGGYKNGNFSRMSGVPQKAKRK